jgi:hypothetical protein
MQEHYRFSVSAQANEADDGARLVISEKRKGRGSVLLTIVDVGPFPPTKTEHEALVACFEEALTYARNVLTEVRESRML